ncbi:MAG: sigma-54-dependent Fis family transcriptional regulator [Planctomycetales bacterium]|nr:sigma-54-dependent Fis family transcriptional regulator [Planctomycetales bacterium]
MEDQAATAVSSAPPIRVLVVDNDKSHAQAMAETLARVNYDCTVATSGPEGARWIDQDSFDVVITDLVMNEVDGEEILRRAKETLPDCEVIVVTGHASVPKAVEAMQQGAFNFMEKPLTPDRLRAVTAKAADAVRLKKANVDLQQRLDERFGFEGIIYASDQMKAVIERLKRLAPTDASVLITGETGTGKELIAQALHQNSPRKKKPFVALNCAALSEHLLESELFGHVRGAYTDAQTDRVGRFEYAHGGTLFLDEVGDMPMPTQIKLLRVLESGEIVRVGENKPVSVNVRVLSATNRELEQAIEEGAFRRDLYHRLKVVTIDLPPLRARRDDIVPLADYFRKQFVKRHKKSVRGISGAASRMLIGYDWPGNVRQLRNAVESMVVIDVDEILDVDDLPVEIAETIPAVAAGAAAAAGAGTELIGRPLSDIERWAVEQTLQLTGGNREETARILGIGARTLYRKIKEYGL